MSSLLPKQEKTTTRAQVVNQNFANSILFKNMSVLQTLEQKVKQEKGTKFFGGYDIIDYSDRPKEMLKEQLRLGLFHVQYSYGELNKDYKNGYVFPKEYGIDQVIQRLKQFYNFFKDKDEDILLMVDDFINILMNKNTKRHYETARFDSGSSKGFNGNVKNMVQAASVTQKEQQMMQQKYKNNPGMKPEDLGFKHNPNYAKKKSDSKHKQDKQENRNEGSQHQSQGNAEKSGQNKGQSNAMDQQHRKPIVQGQDSNKTKIVQNILYQNGSYSGEVTQQNLPHGYGKLSYSDKEFQGQFVNGYFNGKIKVTQALTGKFWQQIWKDGKKIK